MTHAVCKYCEDQGPSRGFLWTDNNGPVVACPICNSEYDTPKARRQREYDAAEYQRLVSLQERAGSAE
jgi:hypothetical protein